MKLKSKIFCVLVSLLFLGVANAQYNKSKTMNNEAKTVIENMAKQYAANADAMNNLSDSQKLEAGRKGYEGIIPMAGNIVEVFEVGNKTISGSDNNSINIRLYRPSDDKDLPVLLYIHGGGFTAGNFKTHDRPLRALANRSGFLVIALEYRLAPEHPYPAGLNDCYQVLRWIEENAKKINANANLLFVGGDSAGGNLAIATSLMARDENGPVIKGNVLVYPNTDLTLKSDSWDNLGDKGYVLTKGAMAANVAMYVKDEEDINSLYISPLKAEDLSNLPETLIITGGFDPLHSEGEAYVKKLENQNVQVTHWHYDGQIHGFFQLGGVISQGDELITRISNHLKNSMN